MNTGETIALIKAFGNGGGGGSNKFIVTLTPTSPDYSGTMDKTVAEINTAYEAGQEIIFKLILGATDFIEVPVTGHYVDSSYTYGYFAGYNIDLANNVLIYVNTNLTNDGTNQTYYTTVYSLTRAS